MDFTNKTVVVTGAGKGIGAACAKLFFDAGANVALLNKGADETGINDHRWFAQQCDVSVEAQVKASAERIKERFGTVQYLINNAGIQRYGTVTETGSDEWDEVMNVNLKSIFLCAKYFIPYMQEAGKGVVVNVASVQSFVSQRNVAAYTTAKTAILGLTRSIAIDYAPTVRCVAVCPGTIDTPMLRDAIQLSPDPEEVLQECIDMHPIGRIGTAGEVAEVIKFMCDDAAGFITGQYIRVDGGLGITINGSKKEAL
ncbi:SDR family oxidoreductase [Mucilaginibacter limnophilus]|uniref:SDR family oxidoreductase n=1 Tax=Mucilaginibacter limnophilus TaxID=1932778 RepID=A0A3S2UMK7_9SPHI|nr:SDR family oxidoreductase [Mucilaginibacter limnophilus]RVU02044.1 SDR family oxidoreductase [Mucilaginibacter limnophilus]